MFNIDLNDVFSLGRMRERPIDRALRRAQDLGLNQSELAKALDVQPGHVTNWKRRGLPPSKYEAVALVLKWTVNELLGHGAPGPGSSDAEWPFSVSYAQYDRLADDEKIELDEVVADAFVRIKKRRERQRDKMPVKSGRTSAR